MSEPSACTFYLEAHRKAIKATGEDSSHSSEIWVQVDRVLKLLESEFKHARASDLNKFSAEIEDLLRLPDEVMEINKLREARSNSKEAKQTDEETGLIMAPEIILFNEKPGGAAAHHDAAKGCTEGARCRSAA